MRFVTALSTVTLCLILAACFTLVPAEASNGDSVGAGAKDAGADSGATGVSGTPNAEERHLYKLIMAYRAEEGLPRIPLSPSLTKVAQAHVRDLEAHFRGGGECNLHSWSDQGEWTPCCYTSDHAEAECMWNKPRELTNYPGSGYEISYTHSARADAPGALRSWQGSPGHNSVIINGGVWSSHPWQAIGIGIYGRYAVVWFGEVLDPASE